jgi:hypothetical protein
MQEERSSEFGLLHANLRSLEKAGRILILKHESFLDESEEVSACPFCPVPSSVADPDPGSGMKKRSGSRVQDEQPGSYFLELRNHFLG